MCIHFGWSTFHLWFPTGFSGLKASAKLSTLTRTTESTLTTPVVQQKATVDAISSGNFAEIKPLKKRKTPMECPKESSLAKKVRNETALDIDSTIVPPITATMEVSSTTAILPKSNDAQKTTASKIKATEDFQKALRERRKAFRECAKVTVQKFTEQLHDNASNTTHESKPSSKSKLGASAVHARNK